MKTFAARTAAVLVADVSMRLRRPSTAVLFILLGASAYLWIPNPSTGRALIVAEGQRTLYNAATIGLGTASLASLFIGLFGFYFLSNAVRRDVQTRCGFVIAATPVRNIEYILGKLIANMVFLSTFMLGFAITSLAMLLVRGEAPFEPLVFVSQYLLMVPPSIVMVATLALVFEAVPLLAGRLGDVLYFFIWILTLGAVAIALDQGGPPFLHYLDIPGLGMMIQALTTSLGTANLSVGASQFDPSLPILDFDGLTATGDRILARAVAAALPFLLLPIVLLGFHRFDPAYIRATRAKRDSGRWRDLLDWLRPLSKPLGLLRAGSTGTSIWNAARHDAFVTLSTLPAAAPAMLGFALTTLLIPADRLQGSVLPGLFAVLAICLADIACRDARAGTQQLIYGAPGLARGFVLWKLTTALLISGLFLALPVIRLAALKPRAAFALIVGALVVCAASTCLGVLTHNPKTFMVVFLSFWYLVVSDGGRTPALDFAGFRDAATTVVTGVYLAIAVALTLAAHFVHRARLQAP